MLGLSGNIVTVVLMASLLASLHYLLVILALGAAFLACFGAEELRRVCTRSFIKRRLEEREREYLGDSELVQPRSTKEIRAYVLADYLLGRHRKLSEDLFKQRERMYRSATNISLLTGLVTGTTLALAYLFVAVRGVAGTIDPGGVVLVIGAFTAVSGTLGQISSTFVAVDQHTTFLDDYFSFLAIDPLIPVPANPHSSPDWDIGSGKGGVEFENVTFTYPGGTEPAVEGLNLHIRNGELIALVGEKRAGKRARSSSCCFAFTMPTRDR